MQQVHQRWCKALGLVFCGLLCALMWAPAGARTVEGHRYDEQLTLDGKPLLLNGAGVRQVVWFKGFTVGLWVGQRSTDEDRLMAQDGPKRLRMAPLVDKIDSDLLAKALYDGVAKRVAEADRERMMGHMDQLAKAIRAFGTLRDTDVIDLDYLPTKAGMQLRLNNQAKGDVIVDPGLFNAILSIYIGDRPVDKKLKPALLGLPGE